MSNRVTAKSIRLMGHYNRSSVKASATVTVPVSGQVACKEEPGRESHGYNNEPVRTTMTVPVLDAPFLPPELEEDNAYTIAIDRKSVKASSVLPAHENLIGLALGYIGLSGFLSEKTMQCATLCNDYGEALYERAFDFAAGVATKTPEVMMTLRENTERHYRKGVALMQKGAQHAENGLRQGWNEARGAAARNATYAKQRVDRKYKAFGNYMQEQRQYLDEVVFSRRNMTGLASAGALSVLSVAVYKHGLPIDGESRTKNGIYGFNPQDVVLQQHSESRRQKNDSENGHNDEQPVVSYKIVEAAPPAEENVGAANEADVADAGQEVLAYYDLEERGKQELSESPQSRERREIHDLVTAIPLADSFRVSSGYGLRHHPVTGQHNKMHQGIDIAAPPNTPVEAPADGVVKFAGWKHGYGKVVILDHENGVNTLYAHLRSFDVHRGDRVKKGEAFARVGATGRVTGPHLHFEIHENGRHVNPRQYVRSQRSALQSRLQP